jgi:hypothetical protein
MRIFSVSDLLPRPPPSSEKEKKKTRGMFSFGKDKKKGKEPEEIALKSLTSRPRWNSYITSKLQVPLTFSYY